VPSDVFTRIEALTAPRLVEYWEGDPCAPPPPPMTAMGGGMYPMAAESRAADGGDDLGVRIEARFSVGEYDILILSARDSGGLDTWLRRSHYRIPEGAEPVLRPYVQAGMKFFVAKVNVRRVTFRDGRAILSPLRFHYDTREFSLPVRLGLLNSGGTQDLIVNVIARGQRYEVANYPNVTIPTNLRVTDRVRGRFAEFYAALFDKTEESHPGAVVTEYAWDAGDPFFTPNCQWCDPCPPVAPGLTKEDLLTLGGDVTNADRTAQGPPGAGFVLTRLHARYGRDSLGEDLVFRTAEPLSGGMGMPDVEGHFDTAVNVGADVGQSRFQGRYGILHRWEGPIACENPVRGNWGGPPPAARQAGASGQVQPATGLAFARRGEADLSFMLVDDVDDVPVRSNRPRPPVYDPGHEEREPAASGGCASCSVGDRPEGIAMTAAALLAGLVGAVLFRRKR
jgi:MYXO-CTERM domain-containing protein